MNVWKCTLIGEEVNTFLLTKAVKVQTDGITAPESLSHTLCKTVLTQLANQGISTLLKPTYQTEAQTPIPITFTSGICEYPISIANNHYLIDAFCHFSQAQTDEWLQSYECRWNGQIAFEFFHTHRLSANSPKCRDLASVGIPVFQIAIKAGSFFYIDEEELMNLDIEEAENRISEHCRKISNAFKKQIVGVLLNNPKSLAFKHGENLYRHIETNEKRISDLEEKLEQAYENINSLLAENSQLNSANAQYYNHLRQIQKNMPSAVQEHQSAEPQTASSNDETSFWRKWFK